MARKTSDIGQWYADVPRSGRVPTVIGILVLLATIFGFGAWAGTAPIAGAVVAPGTFVATGQNKIVQHLEGGIIKDILVGEGDVVEAGQTLIRLDSTAPNASLRRLVLHLNRQLGTRARLRAEAEERPEITFPAELLEHSNDPDIKSIIENERTTFKARRDQLISEIAILKQGIAAFEERIAGGKAQLKAVNAQLTYIDEELKGKAALYAKGLMQKPQLLAVQRAQARLTGEVGRLLGDIGDNKERIARAKRQVAHVKFQRVEKAVDELHETESEIRDVRERLRAAQDVLKRIEINAPVRGVIVKMKYHTPGGVIEAGKDILEMLPVGEELVIQARVRPQDIDNVKTGQEAIVRLTALSQRVTPMVPGKVVYVSADTLPEDINGNRLDEDIYVARIRLDAEKAGEVTNFHATPGMPAEIYIKTGERTFFEYLLQPVVDSMTRAFRES